MTDKTDDGKTPALNLLRVLNAVIDRLQTKIASGDIKSFTREQSKLLAAITLVVLDANDVFRLFPVVDPLDLDELETAVKEATR